MYDLIVIGGGMSGISVGHYFRNQNILVLEKGKLLSGATGHNAGFIVSGFGEHFHRTVLRQGLDRAREIQEIHRASHLQIRSLAQNIDCNYRQSGSYAVAGDETERNDLWFSYELLRDQGYAVEWVETPPVGLKELCGSILNRDDGVFDQIRFWSRLAEGLPVRTNCEVLSVHENSVETTQGFFYGKRIVFCLNAFAAALVPDLNGRYIPLRGQMLETPVEAEIPTDLPVFTRYGDIYWRFLPGKLWFGGLEAAVPEDEVGIAAELSKQIKDSQIEWIKQHFAEQSIGMVRASRPQASRRAKGRLADGTSAPQVTKAWCSTMAFTVDGFPFVGRLAHPDHYVLSGLCGIGHSYALEGARWLYELIENGRDIIPPYCASDRIKTLPVYTEGNWRTIHEAWNY